MKKVGVFLLAFLFLFCLSALPIMAADKEVEQLKSDVQKLLKKIEELEKKQESVEKVTTRIEQEEAKLKEDKKTRAIAYYRDGFFIETPDKKFRLNMAGVLHFDTRIYEGGRSPSSFDIRRARYDMRGNLFTGDIEHLFRLQVEMADPIALRNAYWTFRFRPELAIQIGQFKVPSGGSDWLTEEAHVNFIEYATDRPITPDFDRGINIHSKFLGGKIQTNLAMVTGTGYDVDYGPGDWDPHKNIAGRVLLVPFNDSDKLWLKGMHFAGAYETGLQSMKTARGESSNRSENYQSQWYRWTQDRVDVDKRTRYGGEFHWIAGSATLSYEFNRVEWEDIKVYQSADVRDSTGKLTKKAGTLLRTFPDRYHSDVHQIWVSYFLTGEQKVFEDVFFAWRQPKPKKNFSIKDGTWGAWEVMARYAKHDTSEDLFTGSNSILDGSNKGYSVTGGLRWIWNPKTRLMFDVNCLKSDEGKGIVVERAKEGGARVRGYKETETALLMRLILTP